MRNFGTENITLKGTFGDHEIHVSRCIPKISNSIQVALLHGVYSCASLERFNKFRALARVLAGKGFTPWLIETSRKVRDKNSYGADTEGWVRDAFFGKTFAMEQEDVFIALRDIIERTKNMAHWVWGFSMGGLIALSAAAGGVAGGTDNAPVFDRVILSGTGLSTYDSFTDGMMKMPVLSTLRATLTADILDKVRTNCLIVFRGTADNVFPREACLDILKNVHMPEKVKHFFEIKDADHSLRCRNGRHDVGIMREMAEIVEKI